LDFSDDNIYGAKNSNRNRRFGVAGKGFFKSFESSVKVYAGLAQLAFGLLSAFFMWDMHRS